MQASPVLLLAAFLLVAGCAADLPAAGPAPPAGEAAPGPAQESTEAPGPLRAELAGCAIHLGYLPFPAARAPLPAGWLHVPFAGVAEGTFVAALYECGDDREAMGATLVQPPAEWRDETAAAHLVFQNALTASAATRPMWERAGLPGVAWAEILEFHAVDRALHVAGRYNRTDVDVTVAPAASPTARDPTVMRFFAIDEIVTHAFRLDIPARLQADGGVAALSVRFGDGSAFALPPGLAGHATALEGPLVWSFDGFAARAGSSELARRGPLAHVG